MGAFCSVKIRKWLGCLLQVTQCKLNTQQLATKILKFGGEGVR